MINESLGFCEPLRLRYFIFKPPFTGTNLQMEAEKKLKSIRINRN